VKRIAVKVCRHIEPCPGVLVGHIDNQSVAIPVAARIAFKEPNGIGYMRSVVQRPIGNWNDPV
jgi:hypothetical protein